MCIRDSIQPVQKADCLIHQLPTLLYTTEISLKNRGASARCLDLRHRGFGAFPAAGVMQDDIRTLARKFQRDFTPNPGARSSDQHALALHLVVWHRYPQIIK